MEVISRECFSLSRLELPLHPIYVYDDYLSTKVLESKLHHIEMKKS